MWYILFVIVLVFFDFVVLFGIINFKKSYMVIVSLEKFSGVFFFDGI